MLTPWGYEIALPNGTNLPDILSEAEFNTLTGNRWQNDPMARQAVAAASQAVRNWCGWHVAPNEPCSSVESGCGRMIHLPVMGLTAVTEIKENGITLNSASYEFNRQGIIRRVDGLMWPDRWGGITIKYNAGYEADAILKQVVTQLAVNAIAAPYGVREEHAGNVGQTFNTIDGIAGGISLSQRDIACLAPYRLDVVI